LTAGGLELRVPVARFALILAELAQNSHFCEVFCPIPTVLKPV